MAMNDNELVAIVRTSDQSSAGFHVGGGDWWMDNNSEWWSWEESLCFMKEKWGLQVLVCSPNMCMLLVAGSPLPW